VLLKVDRFLGAFPRFFF